MHPSPAGLLAHRRAVLLWHCKLLQRIRAVVPRPLRQTALQHAPQPAPVARRCRARLAPRAHLAALACGRACTLACCGLAKAVGVSQAGPPAVPTSHRQSQPHIHMSVHTHMSVQVWAASCPLQARTIVPAVPAGKLSASYQPPQSLPQKVCILSQNASIRRFVLWLV